MYFDHVQYSKKQYYNRTTIKTANGPLVLSVPVATSGRSHETMIHEAKIDNSGKWKRDHWKALQLAYGKAPYFGDYSKFFSGVYERDWELLTDLNRAILRQVLEWLDINVRWLEWGDVNPVGQKSDLVLDMCRKVGCKHYIFGKMGEEYADREAFADAGIDIHFQDYKHPTYDQQFMQQGFLPYMSVVDLLFNEGPKSKDILLLGNVTRGEILRQ